MAGYPYHFETMRTARVLMACAVLLLLASVVLLPVLVRLGTYGVLGAVLLGLLTIVAALFAVQHSDEAGWLFEYNLRRKFRAVCDQRGLTATNDRGRTVYPMLTRLMGDLDSWTVTIRPLYGQSVADWEKAGAAFGLAFAVAGVRFRDNGDGTVMMRAGYQRLEAREMVVAGLEDDAPAVLAAEVTWRERLTSVEAGTTESGQPYRLPLLDTHLLVVGITGAGKGSVLWSLMLGLLPFVRAGVVNLWGVDPKRLELALGREVFGDRYASDEETVIELLDRAVSEMHKRADALAGQTRKFEPSPDMPVNVLVLDELGYLASLISDRKVAQRVEKAISTLLVLGRALGFVVVGAIQDPRKDNIDFRDLFPTKIAMKLEKPMVDLVLGTGMHEAGALCDLIPLGKDGAGVAFVKLEGSGLPVCVRFSWCSDELIKKSAAALAPVTQSPRLAAS